ncbi:MAG: 4Fe-4S binding protein [Armatimonadota bacterium]
MKRITIYRRLSQAVFFGITGTWLAIGSLRCPFGVPFVSCQSCPSTDCPGRHLQLPFIALAGLSGLLFGRAVCGWSCPVGFVMDVAGRFPKLKSTVSARFTALDRYLKPLKWVAVPIAVYLVYALNFTEARAFPYVIRTSSVFNLEAVELAQALGDPAHAVRMWIIIGAVLAGLIVSRAWCRYLCPLGAVLGLFNKFSVLRIGGECEGVSRCDALPGDCIMHTRPSTTDCVICGECIEGCPRQCLRLQSRYSRGRSSENAGEAPPRADRDAS